MHLRGICRVLRERCPELISLWIVIVVSGERGQIRWGAQNTESPVEPVTCLCKFLYSLLHSNLGRAELQTLL